MHWRDLPNLGFLPAFEAAGRLGSFKAAAAELYITPSAVSQQIKLLEDTLGVALFERRGRAAMLTPAGASYLHEVRQLLQSLAQASRRLRDGGEEKVLRISTTPLAAHELLLPRLPALRARFPELELSVEATMECVDFSTHSIHAALRVGGPQLPGLTVRPLGPVFLAPVCSPAMASKIRGLSDARAHPLVELRNYPQRGLRQLLELEHFDGPLPPIWKFETCMESVCAAEQGLGIAMGVFPLLSSWVEAGRLCVPLASRQQLPDVALVYPSAYESRFPLLELARYLKEEYERLPALPEGRVTGSKRSASVSLLGRS